MTTKKKMPLIRLYAQITAIEEKVKALEALTQALDAVFKTLDGQVSLLEQHRIEDCKREYNQDERIKALEGYVHELCMARDDHLIGHAPFDLPPSTPRFKRPCFCYYTEKGSGDPAYECSLPKVRYSSCHGVRRRGLGWEDCEYGGKSPHLAEYRWEEPEMVVDVCGFDMGVYSCTYKRGHIGKHGHDSRHAAGTCVPRTIIPCEGCVYFNKVACPRNGPTMSLWDQECGPRTRWREAEARAKRAEEDAERFLAALGEQLKTARSEERERVAKELDDKGRRNAAEEVRAMTDEDVKDTTKYISTPEKYDP